MPDYVFRNLDPRAAVTVTDAEDAEADTGRTDLDGSYTAEGLDVGRYVARTANNQADGAVVPLDGDVWTYSDAVGGYTPVTPAAPE